MVVVLEQMSNSARVMYQDTHSALSGKICLEKLKSAFRMLLAEIWTTRSQAPLESEMASRPFREKTVLTLTKGLHTSYQDASAQGNSGPSKIVSPPVQPTGRGNWPREEKTGAEGEQAHGAKCELRFSCVCLGRRTHVQRLRVLENL